MPHLCRTKPATTGAVRPVPRPLHVLNLLHTPGPTSLGPTMTFRLGGDLPWHLASWQASHDVHPQIPRSFLRLGPSFFCSFLPVAYRRAGIPNTSG